MKCPTCHSEMTAGEIALETTVADWATGGAGFAELRFRQTGANPVRILGQSESQPGVRCDPCGHFVIITDAEFTDTTCLVCSTKMAAGVATCPNCGWTYKTAASVVTES